MYWIGIQSVPMVMTVLHIMDFVGDATANAYLIRKEIGFPLGNPPPPEPRERIDENQTLAFRGLANENVFNIGRSIGIS